MYSRYKLTLWLSLIGFLIAACSQAQNSTLLSTPPFTTLSTVAPPTAAPTVEPGATTTPEPSPTPPPVSVEEIRFQSDNFSIVGDLQLPGGDGPHPLVIMVHGDGDLDRTAFGTYLPLMERFLDAGYAVFSWDKPGMGASTGEFAHGSELLSDRADILVAAVEYIKQNLAIDPGRIGMWGISQAGYVMPLALTRTGDLTFMIIIGGPAMNSFDQMVYLIGQQFRCTGYTEQDSRKVEEFFRQLFYADTYGEYREAKEYLVRFPYALNFTGDEIAPQDEWSPEVYSDWVYFNPLEIIETTTVPLLVIYGEKDTQVDPYQGAAAYAEALERAGNQNYQIELFPDADHNVVISRTGCMEERDSRSREDWVNYAPGYLDLMENWLLSLDR